MLPPRLGMLLNGDADSIASELIAICPGSDRAKANLMAIAHLENSSPPNVSMSPASASNIPQGTPWNGQ